jgi:hypothetical protein
VTRGEVKVALDMQEMTCGNSSMTEDIATVALVNKVVFGA